MFSGIHNDCVRKTRRFTVRNAIIQPSNLAAALTNKCLGDYMFSLKLRSGFTFRLSPALLGVGEKCDGIFKLPPEQPLEASQKDLSVTSSLKAACNY